MKFMDHPSFWAVSAPQESSKTWTAYFATPGGAQLKIQANERLTNLPDAGEARRIDAPTRPELEKRCDDFLRVYDAEVKPKLAPPF